MDVRQWGAAALAVALLVVGAVLSVVPGSASPAAPLAACTSHDDVTVVVDFGTLGGGVQVRCATGPVTSGFQALTKAGFTVQGTDRFPGLLCRINDVPADDPCHNAPPGDRYWAYWTAASPGGAWTYSDEGAATHQPPAGSVEGWAFSDGCTRPPDSGPCPMPTTSTGPPTTYAATTSTAGAGGSTPSDPTPDDPTEVAAVGPADGTGGERASEGSTSTSRSGGTAPLGGEPGDEDALAATPGSVGPGAREGAGSPIGLLVGATIVAGLGVAGARTARRRRGADATGG